MGPATSGIRGRDTLSGAVGALAAEVAGDVILNAKGVSGGLDRNSPTYADDYREVMALVDVITTSTAVALGLDPEEARKSGAIAVRENSFENLHKNESAELEAKAEKTKAGKINKGINDVLGLFEFGYHDPERPLFQEIYEGGSKAYVQRRIVQQEERQGRPLSMQEENWCRTEAILRYNAIAYHLEPTVIGTQVRRLTNFLGLDAPLKATKTWVGNMVDAPFTIIEKVALKAGASEAEIRAFRHLGEKALQVLPFMPVKPISVLQTVAKPFRFEAAAEGQLASNFAKMDSIVTAKANSKVATQLNAPRAKMLEGLDLAGAQKIKGRQVVDSSTFGPNSKITALERPGFVKFDNVEFRAVRDLGHVDSEYLKLMYKTGKNPYDIAGTPLVGHHFKQIDHRAAGGFIVEIPKNNHTIANKIQHPHGNKKGMGLTAKQKIDWSKTRQEFNKDRAKQELIKRGEMK